MSSTATSTSVAQDDDDSMPLGYILLIHVFTTDMLIVGGIMALVVSYWIVSLLLLSCCGCCGCYNDNNDDDDDETRHYQRRDYWVRERMVLTHIGYHLLFVTGFVLSCLYYPPLVGPLISCASCGIPFPAVARYQHYLQNRRRYQPPRRRRRRRRNRNGANAEQEEGNNDNDDDDHDHEEEVVDFEAVAVVGPHLEGQGEEHPRRRHRAVVGISFEVRVMLVLTAAVWVVPVGFAALAAGMLGISLCFWNDCCLLSTSKRFYFGLILCGAILATMHFFVQPEYVILSCGILIMIGYVLWNRLRHQQHQQEQWMPNNHNDDDNVSIDLEAVPRRRNSDGEIALMEMDRDSSCTHEDLLEATEGPIRQLNDDDVDSQRTADSIELEAAPAERRKDNEATTITTTAAGEEEEKVDNHDARLQQEEDDCDLEAGGIRHHDLADTLLRMVHVDIEAAPREDQQENNHDATEEEERRRHHYYRFLWRIFQRPNHHHNYNPNNQ